MLPVNTAGSPGGGLQWPSRGGGDLGGTCDADGVDADGVDTVGLAAGGSWRTGGAWLLKVLLMMGLLQRCFPVSVAISGLAG